MTNSKNEDNELKGASDRNTDREGIEHFDFPEGYNKLFMEEKIPFLIVKCIESMTDFDTRHYGRKRIGDILKGTCSRFILENGHHHNPCYGVLEHLTRREIGHYIDRLIESNILCVEDEVFPTLGITRTGRKVARLQKRIRIEHPTPLEPHPVPTFDLGLYSHLCDVRLVQAKDEGVPPYCVIPNRAIMELCVTPPATVEELMRINGFGPARTQRYGELFINALRDYSKAIPAK